MSHVLPVGDRDFNDRVINSDRALVVDFYAAWCGPCANTMRAIEEFIEDGHSEWRGRIYKVDIDANGELVRLHDISGVPTLVLFQNGQEKKREVGSMSKKALEKILVSWLD